MAYQTIIGIDKSMSMRSGHNGTTRMDVAKELANSVISRACEVDPDGPDLFTFGRGVQSFGTVSLEKVSQVLSSLSADDGQTDTGEFLRAAFGLARTYQQRGDQTLILVVTDGDASDKALVEREIIAHTKQMTDDSQCAVEFVAIGNEAAAYLTRLDDSLTGAQYDIVDATPIEQAVLLGLEGLYSKAFND